MKIAIYCGEFTQMVWQGIHHTLVLSRAGKKAIYFPGKYLNEARNVIDFTSNRGATIKDIF